MRISGPDTFTIIDNIFSKRITDANGYTVHFGQIKDHANDETIDDVLVTVFRAPHSYTGEDSAEVSCHASPYIVERICQLLMSNGCQAAMPGEFTRRAFMNGKLDLSQAEAVADLIASSNRASHQIALNQLKGGFSSELNDLREHLLHLTTLLELELDFSDHEELEFADRTELVNLVQTIDRRIDSLIRTFKTGQAIKKGIPVAIIGATNVGKSTLLNQLLHEDKAIVSDVHGTTRDVIEDTVTINGITFRFIDTAGIRSTDDEIERLGIERTYMKLQEAQIILWMLDTIPEKETVEHIMSLVGEKSLIVVFNKIDTVQHDGTALSALLHVREIVSISAKYGTNISALEDAIYAAAHIPDIHNSDVIVTNIRHYDALCHARAHLEQVHQAMIQNVSAELIAEDLRSVLADLAEITGGQISTQETLSNIFSHFCVGK